MLVMAIVILLEILSTELDYPSRLKALKIEYLWMRKNKG